MRSQKPHRRVLLAAGALVAAGLLPALFSAPARAQTATVRMFNTTFDPSTIRIPVGGTVTWVNQDMVVHTATEDHNAWTSRVLNQGDTYSHTFSQAGTVTYYCVVHPGLMKGTIIVGGDSTAAAQPTAPTQTTAVATVAPPPTSIATAAVYPAAGQLYQRSMQALKSTTGYRISESAVRHNGGKKQTFTLSGIVAARSNEERLTLRLAINGRRTARTDIVQIKKSAWIKRASRDRRWRTVKASRVDSLLSPLRNPLKQPSGGSVSNLATVGPDTFLGAAVWHISWTETSGSTSGTVDTLVAQKGFLPYLTVRSVERSSIKAHVDDRITRSRFGEKIQINPPKN